MFVRTDIVILFLLGILPNMISFDRLLGGVMNLAENLPIPEIFTEPVIVAETNSVVLVS